jgi:hypothetical protein
MGLPAVPGMGLGMAMGSAPASAREWVWAPAPGQVPGSEQEQESALRTSVPRRDRSMIDPCLRQHRTPGATNSPPSSKPHLRGVRHASETRTLTLPADLSIGRKTLGSSAFLRLRTGAGACDGAFCQRVGQSAIGHSSHAGNVVRP